MSCPDWNEIRKEYITTNVSQRALAKKYKVSTRTIGDRSKREGWVELRIQHRGKTVAKTLDKAAEIASEVNKKLYESANKALARIDGMLDREEGSIKEITGALRDIKIILDAKSEADMEEQRARIDKLRREAQEEKNEPKSITVTIEGGGEGWAS